MFKALKDHADDLSYQRGGIVFIPPRQMVSISESQELELHEGFHQATAVERFLADWCRDNIKGKWKSEYLAGSLNDLVFESFNDPVAGVYFHFSKKSEAVRFKLTWG